jgi:hypothetical protein
MLTVKLLNEKLGRTRSVECAEVITDRTGGMAMLILKKADGTSETVSVVNKLDPELKVEDYHVAYVENAQGRTIQTVRP